MCRSSPISHTHRLYPHNLCSIKLAHTNFVVLLLPYPGRQFPYLRQHTCVLCMTSLAISNLGTGQIISGPPRRQIARALATEMVVLCNCPDSNRIESN